MKFRKVLSLLLALLMVASAASMLFVTASAEEPASTTDASITAFESIMAYKARKTAAEANTKTRTGDIGHRSSTDYSKAVDKDFTTRFCSYGASSYYASIYVDATDKKVKNDELKFYGFCAIIK